jgi:hypothetical protein
MQVYELNSTRMEVHGFLKEHGAILHYTVKDLERDCAAHESCGL